MAFSPSGVLCNFGHFASTRFQRTAAMRFLAALTIFVFAMALIGLTRDQNNWMRGFWLGVNPLLFIWFILGIAWTGKRIVSRL